MISYFQLISSDSPFDFRIRQFFLFNSMKKRQNDPTVLSVLPSSVFTQHLLFTSKGSSHVHLHFQGKTKNSTIQVALNKYPAQFRSLMAIYLFELCLALHRQRKRSPISNSAQGTVKSSIKGYDQPCVQTIRSVNKVINHK